MTHEEKLKLLALLEAKKEISRLNKIADTWRTLYGWQKKFVNATRDNIASCLMAANRVGKSYTGCFVDAVHLTGDYPEDWEGHRFKHPPLVWILGYSGDKIRDILQQPIFGSYSGGELEGGIIPKERIVDAIPMMGTPRCVREVKVKHKSGGVSRCQFWSYSQGQHALMGDSVDWYHIDEEPKDRFIYPQVLTRTATGDKGNGGRGILTFTPENGRTELVVQFMDNPEPGQYIQRATWDDAQHLTDETKQTLLAMFPAWQRDMRTKGIPLLGAGLIFDLDVKSLCSEKPFDIPAHWWVIDGMDFGWDHPQAHIQLWWDKDNDVFYVARAWKKSKQQPYQAWQQVKSWAKDAPTAWPADGFQTEKGTGNQQKSYYEDAGWNMLHEHATWGTSAKGGATSVEQGLVELYNLIELGKFKIFDNLSDVFDEFLQYHRDDNGKIVKVNDDLLDAIRYAYMMRRHAVQANKIGKSESVEIEFDSFY